MLLNPLIAEKENHIFFVFGETIAIVKLKNENSMPKKEKRQLKNQILKLEKSDNFVRFFS